MSKLIVPIHNHYIGRVTWRGQVAMKMIKEKFEELKLVDKVKKCPFKHFFKAPSLQFSGVIIHQLLL